MPRNQSTAAQRARRAGGKYTEALREEQELGPAPRLVPIASTWCEPGCDASPHPGASCRTWSPFNYGQATVEDEFDACRAADLPRGRVTSLGERFAWRHPNSSDFRSPWYFALLYAMLLDEQPELRPDPRALRAAVELGDIAAVDLVMAPLDRAAVRLIDAPETGKWSDVTFPRIEAFVERTLSDDGPHARYVRGEIETWDVTVRGELHVAVEVAEQWREAYTPKRGWDGYMGREGVISHEPLRALDSVLLAHTGGYLMESMVEVDGEQLQIRGAEWGDEGPPVAYFVLPAESRRGFHDWKRVKADQLPPPVRQLTALRETDRTIAQEKKERSGHHQTVRCAAGCGWQGSRWYKGFGPKCPKCGAGMHVAYSGMELIWSDHCRYRSAIDGTRIAYWVQWTSEVTVEYR